MLLARTQEQKMQAARAQMACYWARAELKNFLNLYDGFIKLYNKEEHWPNRVQFGGCDAVVDIDARKLAALVQTGNIAEYLKAQVDLEKFVDSLDTPHLSGTATYF